MIHCGEFEVLLADFMDGALDAPSREADRTEFTLHMESCAACAAMAREVQSAMTFMERAAEPEYPAELTARILNATNSGWELKLRGSGVRGWINRTFAPVLRPRMVMGAMLTLMSLTMLTRCAGGNKPMTAADLDPVRVWTSLETRTSRIWNQAVKSYESMKVVYEIRTQIDEWNKQQAADEEAAADAKADSRRVEPAGARGASGSVSSDVVAPGKTK